MKEIEVILRTVADGLKTMAQGIGSLAEKLDTIAKAQAEEKPSTAVKKRPPKPSQEKPPSSKTRQTASRSTPLPVTEQVLDLISKSEEGVNTDTIMEKTGYDRKKVHNIIYKLKRQGRIENSAKGVYRKR